MIGRIGYFLFAILVLASCQKKPKVIHPVAVETGEDQKGKNNPISEIHRTHEGGSLSSDIHEAIVTEILETAKYSYLRVTDAKSSAEYWIATIKRPFKTGERYYYKEGILKRNFESREHQRVFKELYLVSNLTPATHGDNLTEQNLMKKDQPATFGQTHQDRHEFPIPIADLAAHRDRYNGQKVIVSGKCVKVNRNIMGRNWIHLQDGSTDDYDLVATSGETVSVGDNITIQGVVALDKDFGAGYVYSLIIENGEILK
jgi:hypothetical protein